MTFAWQGFQFEHPEEWSPVVLSGDRKAGYVRIASPGRLACQVRWHRGNGKSLRASLDRYLDRLSQDSRKAKAPFRSDIEEDGETLLYSYKGAYDGRGTLITTADGRVFFAEVFGGRTDSILTPFRRMRQAFRFADYGQPERWCLFNLDVTIPNGMRLLSKTLLAGRTRVELSKRGLSLSIERWAFGDQLLAKHGMEPWSRSLLKLPNAECSETSEMGMRFASRTLTGRREALIASQPDRNQLVVIDARFRDVRWRPQWDWLN